MYCEILVQGVNCTRMHTETCTAQFTSMQTILGASSGHYCILELQNVVAGAHTEYAQQAGSRMVYYYANMKQPGPPGTSKEQAVPLIRSNEARGIDSRREWEKWWRT